MQRSDEDVLEIMSSQVQVQVWKPKWFIFSTCSKVRTISTEEASFQEMGNFPLARGKFQQHCSYGRLGRLVQSSLHKHR